MKIRVLLVDDEKDYVDALAERLEARNFSVGIALSGNDALEQLKEQDADVVLLDLVMPEKSGVETLREIKRIRPLAEVVMLTGHATVESAVEAMEKGAYYYLIKPTDTKKLLETIANAYRHKAEHEERIRKAEIERIMQIQALD